MYQLPIDLYKKPVSTVDAFGKAGVDTSVRRVRTVSVLKLCPQMVTSWIAQGQDMKSEAKIEKSNLCL